MTTEWLFCGEHPDFPEYLAALKAARQSATPNE